MDFEAYFKVHNLVSVYPKGIILSRMTNLNMIFHVVVSVHQFVKIWNSPKFLLNFGMAYLYKFHTALFILMPYRTFHPKEIPLPSVKGVWFFFLELHNIHLRWNYMQA